MASTDNNYKNITLILGEVLTLISNIAQTIRMSSNYCPDAKRNPQCGEAVMWLSDSIHNLEYIGESLSSGNLDRIKDAVIEQAKYWEFNKDNITKNSQVSMPMGKAIFDIEEGITLMNKLAEL